MVASHAHPTRDLAHNPGRPPDWESNQQPCGSQAGAQSTEPRQPGPRDIFISVHFFLTLGFFDFLSEMAPRKGKEKKEEQVISLGPQVAEGENVFGVCHIFASFNDTFVHVTDLSGK